MSSGLLRPSLGDSIAVNGCCLTLAERRADAWRFDVIRQTLDVTTLGALRAGDRVNLEASATPTTLLGGHLVQGHIDGVGEILRVDADDEAWRLRIAAPEVVRPMLIDKGSITVDGVSLTIARLEPLEAIESLEPLKPLKWGATLERIGQVDRNVRDDQPGRLAPGASRSPHWFDVALIPTTLRKTTLADRVAGDRVNLESDALVRMVAALLPRLR